MNKAIKSEKGGEGWSKDTWEYLPVARSIQQAFNKHVGAKDLMKKTSLYFAFFIWQKGKFFQELLWVPKQVKNFWNIRIGGV
jgi:hypothetical protein